MSYRTKPGVELTGLSDKLRLVLSTIEEVFSTYDSYLVITSGHEGLVGDGVHRADSKHYRFEAVDCRAKHLHDDTVLDITALLRTKLGPEFDVVPEHLDKQGNVKKHVHVEVK